MSLDSDLKLFDYQRLILRDGSNSSFLIATLAILQKLWIDSFVEAQTHCVVLFNGSVEETLHGAMLANALFDFAIQAVFGRQSGRLEPLHVFGIVEHVFDRGKAFVNSDGISGEDYSLYDNSVRIGSNH